ncbi:MAG: type IX secretion system PorP/SprF family membrane protein, partial [Limisphaerales bacterium]
MKKLILILLLSAAQLLQAQDVHTSQSFALTPLFNPAATGQFDGLYRIGIAYRDQWRTVTVPYRTLSFFADFNIPTHKKLPNSFGAGFYFNTDQAGDANLNTTEAGLQLAYHQSLSREGNIIASVGFGFAYGQKRVDI